MPAREAKSNQDESGSAGAGPTVIGIRHHLKLHTLVCDNYDAWERRLKAIFYVRDGLDGYV